MKKLYQFNSIYITLHISWNAVVHEDDTLVTVKKITNLKHKKEFWETWNLFKLLVRCL